MIELSCLHNCDDCPSWTSSGQTKCKIMNKILLTLEYEHKKERHLYNIALKEGETNG